MQAEMREDLALARASLRDKLGDLSAGRTLCVPFTQGGEPQSALPVSWYRSDVLGRVAGATHQSSWQRSAATREAEERFPMEMPGEGRKSLGSIYAAKVKRRLAGERPILRLHQ